MSDTRTEQYHSVAGKLFGLASGFEDDDLFQSLDKLAKCAADDLEVERIMISISQGDLLQTLGSFPAIGKDLAARAHKPNDTACTLALKLEATLCVEDARLNVSLRDLPYVKNGRIVGYLGVPIEVAGYGFVGSICAISREPRTWTSLESKYLEQFSQTVSMCLLAAMNQIEHGHLSDDLSALDQIVATLAAEISVPTSIYTETGEMAFANAALTSVAPLEIVTAYQKRRRARVANTAQSDSDGQPYSELIKFAGLSGNPSQCRVVCSESSSGMTVCKWYPKLSEIN